MDILQFFASTRLVGNMKVVKKSKSTFPDHSPATCIAVNNSTNARCHRPSKHGCFFCAVHTKRFPSIGVLTQNSRVFRQVVYVKELKGIPYFIDDKHCVYHHEDILKNKHNPQKIGSWKEDLSANLEFTIVFFKADSVQKTSSSSHICA
jgi:hypothetical protein